MPNDAGHLGQADRTQQAHEPDHLERIQHLLVRFGKFAESLFDYHDLGFPREAVRDHVANVDAEIRRIQEIGADAFLGIPSKVLQDEVEEVWNARKNLRYAAGALMIASRFRNEVEPANRLRALRLMVLYEVYIDTIDDFIDNEDYSFCDALDLMRYCVGSLTATRFERPIFRDELVGRLATSQRHLAEFMTCLAQAIHRGIRESPQGTMLIGELDRLHENWALGQAYTMYQKDPTVDVRAFLTGSSRLPAPDPDVKPLERVSGWVSHTTALTLLELCFANAPMSAGALEEHLAAWFYFDAVITLLDNVMDLPNDLEDGIANIFLIGCRGRELDELRTARGFQPTMTMHDYETYLDRVAELARRCLEHARRSCDDADSFYPFISVMAPVVMFVTEVGIREDVLHAYLRSLAPMMRKVLASAAEPVPTIPLGTRSGRSRSVRTASS